jgi:large subunit ribosomal protein L22
VTGPKTNEREGTRAFLRSAPMSAYKVREVLDLIRGQEVGRAAEILEFCERGPAEVVGKILASAVANAANNDELDPEELFVSACFADEAKTQRRMRPRARGRATRIRKRSAHITVIVSRLPEDRLARLRAKRAAEQAARRTRRGRGATQARATRRRRAAAEAPHEHDHDHEHEHDQEELEDVTDAEVVDEGAQDESAQDESAQDESAQGEGAQDESAAVEEAEMVDEETAEQPKTVVETEGSEE